MDFRSKDFQNKLLEKTINNQLPKCPYCGNTMFIAPEEHAYVIVTNKKDIDLTQHIPCGMVVCNKCGHVDFFALGALGLLKNEKK